MLRFSLPGCKRKILFSAALNFSPDRPHPTAKFALPKIKFSRFRLGRKNSTCSKQGNFARMSDTVLNQTNALLRGSFELEQAAPPATEAELLAILTERVAEMLERRPDYLMSLLYRLDVLEEKIRPVMRPDAPEPAPLGLARLVLERQKQRVLTKLTIKPKTFEGMDDWQW